MCPAVTGGVTGVLRRLAHDQHLLAPRSRRTSNPAYQGGGEGLAGLIP